MRKFVARVDMNTNGVMSDMESVELVEASKPTLAAAVPTGEPQLHDKEREDRKAARKSDAKKKKKKLQQMRTNSMAGGTENRDVPLDDYEYTTLLPGYIRLVDFESRGGLRRSDSGELEIHCTLLTRPLSMWGRKDNMAKHLRYQALSYHWGPTHEDGSHLTRQLVCDGKALKVTENVFSTLCYLLWGPLVRSEWRDDWDGFSSGPDYWLQYDPGARQTTWIDAVCIDQKNEDEKSQQIAMMAEIYSQSFRLLICLGPPLEREEQQALSDLLDGIYAEKEMVANLRAARQLSAFFDRPWFRRRWVIQETLATDMKNRWILIGRTVVKVSCLPDLVKPLKLNTAHDQIRLLESADRDPISLLQNAEIYASSQCVDPRDRLFALVNISSHPHRYKPDYRKDWREVYMEFAHLHVNQKSLIRLLISAVTRRVTEGPTSGLPSWVPDWTKRRAPHEAMPLFFKDLPLPAFKFDVMPRGVLHLEGHLLQQCDHLEADRGGDVAESMAQGDSFCAACALPATCDLCLETKDFPLLCLDGAAVLFTVRLSSSADVPLRYTLENCFPASEVHKFSKWLSSRAAPTMHLIV